MRKAGVGTPISVDAMRVGRVGDGESVLEHVDIGRGQADLDFARAVGAGRIEHHVAILLFFLR